MWLKVVKSSKLWRIVVDLHRFRGQGGSDFVFRGENQHTIDSKGRIILPSKFREALGSPFIVTCGLDKCLFVYSLKEWEIIEEKASHLSIAEPSELHFVRTFVARAAEVEVDGQGRTLLPQHLREHALLQKDIVSIGVLNRIEIWDKESWSNYNSIDVSINPETAKRMASLGI